MNKGRINNPIQEQRIIIAGSNGAGKTTFAREFLPNEAGCPVFVNADLIAAGLSFGLILRPLGLSLKSIAHFKGIINESDAYRIPVKDFEIRVRRPGTGKTR